MRFAILAMIVMWVASSRGEVIGKAVDYSADSLTLKGYLAYDNSVKENRPGILVVHEWWGNNDYPKKRAEMLAQLGYVAFAVDMYGNGKVVDNPGDAGKMAGETMSNPATLKARFAAALELLKKNPNVDPDRIGAIGYCYGGGVALNMACAGLDLRGVVSFHGSLAAVTPAKRGEVKATLLVCNGASDKFNSEEAIKKFKAGMDSAKAVYKFIDYPDAVHAFTNPAATEAGKKFNIPIAYNEKADKKSWADMKEFFEMVFKK